MFLKLIARNFQMIYRTLKSIVLRPFTILKYKISSITNISKLLNRIPKFFASLLAKLKMKPEKREDYVDAGSVFVAKSLLVILAVTVIVVPLLIYFIVWPWFASMLLTVKFYEGQPQLENYKGRVEIYYEQKLENLMFKGRLKNGKYTDKGEVFFKNGMQKYSGSYLEGKYDGEGTLYSEDGKQLYKGNFKAGVYDGIGEILLQDGSVYMGDFAEGKMMGKGRVIKGDKLIYEGDFIDGKKAGIGKQCYADGSLNYNGAFAEDVFEGDGAEYYQGGKVKYKGAYKEGMYSGKGVLYDENGSIVYEGSFERGLFSGEGRYYGMDGELAYTGSFTGGLYEGNGKLIFVKNAAWYEGSFMAGKASGEGKLYRDGMLFYEGGFTDDMMSGNGVLTHNPSGVAYTGLFENNDIAYGRLFNLPVTNIYTAFSRGLTEDTSGDDCYYLYNKAFGMVLKLDYANETDAAKLTDAYTLPQKDGMAPVRRIVDFKLPGTYVVGGTGEGRVDADVALFLGMKAVKMKYYKAIYDNYGVCCWTYPDTGEVAVIQYYPSSQTTTGKDLQGNADAPGENGEKGKAVEHYAVYFDDLGLDMKDFGSLGYE